MAGAIVAAAPVVVVTGNTFLAGMGAFAAYMTWTGWRVARRRGAPGTPLDHAVCGLTMVGGLLFAAFGARALVAGHALGLVPVAMGIGAAAFARRHRRWFLDPSRERWVAVHLGAIGGGLIAGCTAFAAAAVTNYLPQVPEPLVWLTPPAVLAPWLVVAGRRYR